jgi:TonB family protein
MRRCLVVIVLALGVRPCLLAQEPTENSTRMVITRIVPVYPELAGKLHLVGNVKLRVTVAPDGAAKTIEVLGGNPVLVKAAQDAVVRWKWTPAPHETKEAVELHFQPR